MAIKKRKINKKGVEQTLSTFDDVLEYIRSGLDSKKNVAVPNDGANDEEAGPFNKVQEEKRSFLSKSGSLEMRSCRRIIEGCKDPNKLKSLANQCLKGETNDHAALLVGIVARMQELKGLKYTEKYLETQSTSGSSIMHECLENIRQEMSLQEIRALSKSKLIARLQALAEKYTIQLQDVLYVAKERLEVKEITKFLDGANKGEDISVLLEGIVIRQQAMRKAVNRYCVSMEPKEKAAVKTQLGLESWGYNEVREYIHSGLDSVKLVLVPNDGANDEEAGPFNKVQEEKRSFFSKSGSFEMRSCRRFIEGCKDPNKLKSLANQCLKGETNDHAALLVGIVARMQELKGLKYTEKYLEEQKEQSTSGSSIMQECLDNIRQEMSLQEIRALSKSKLIAGLQAAQNANQLPDFLYVAKEKLSKADLEKLKDSLSETSKEVRGIAKRQQAMRKAVNRYCVSMEPKEKAAAKTQQRKKDKKIAAKVKPKKVTNKPDKKAILSPNTEANRLRKAAAQVLVARKMVPLTDAALKKAKESLEALKNTELTVGIEDNNKLHSVSSGALITYAEKLFGSHTIIANPNKNDADPNENDADPNENDADPNENDAEICFRFFGGASLSFNRDSLVLYCNQLGIKLSDDLIEGLSFAGESGNINKDSFEILANAQALKEVFDLISDKLIDRLDKSGMKEDAKAKRMEKEAFLAIMNNPGDSQEKKAKLLVGSNLFQRVMKLHQGLIKKGSYPTISYKAWDGRQYELSFSGKMHERTDLPIFEIKESNAPITEDIQVMLGDKVLDEGYLFAPNLVDEDVASILMADSYDKAKDPILDANDLMFSHLSAMTTSLAGRVKDEYYKMQEVFALSDDKELASMVFKGGTLDTKGKKYKWAKDSSAYVVADGKLLTFDHYAGMPDNKGVVDFHSLANGVVSAAGGLCAVERDGITYMFLDISSGHMKGSDIDAAKMAVKDAMVAEGVDREKIVIYTGRNFAGIVGNYDEVDDPDNIRGDLVKISEKGGTSHLTTQELAETLDLATKELKEKFSDAPGGLLPPSGSTAESVHQENEAQSTHQENRVRYHGEHPEEVLMDGGNFSNDPPSIQGYYAINANPGGLKIQQPIGPTPPWIIYGAPSPREFFYPAGSPPRGGLGFPKPLPGPSFSQPNMPGGWPPPAFAPAVPVPPRPVLRAYQGPQGGMSSSV